MTIYNIQIISSSGYPYFNKKIKDQPEEIKLFLRFFDFTEKAESFHPSLDDDSNFSLLAGLVSALFEFAKNINKNINTLSFKSLKRTEKPQKKIKYHGDCLITTQTETYLFNKSIKQKINYIYNSIVSSKIPFESADPLTEEEQNTIIEILTDAKAKNHLQKNLPAINEMAEKLLRERNEYGLEAIAITSFDLSPIKVFGDKYTFEDIEAILRNIGEIPQVDPFEWKYRQSFLDESQVWIYLINSGIGITVDKKLFEPYFYLLFCDPQSYLGDFPSELTRKLNLILD
ncbi:MAG: hypothetical protein ACOC44_03105 [Promethearchaeia archaeon]